MKHPLHSLFIAAAVFTFTVRGPAATVTFDGGPAGTGTALDTAANWSGDALPGTTSEVLLNNSAITLPLQLTTTGANLTWGNLIWNNNATSAITIDSAGATNRSITLSGGGGSAEAIAQGGAAGDLILMGTSAVENTLTIGGNAGAGTARLNLAISSSGNLNVVNSGATLNITAAISGVFNLVKTGAGTLTLAGANTFGSASNNFTLNGGTVNINTATALGHSGNTFIINGGAFDNTSGAALTTSSYKQTWNGDFTFKGTNNLTLGTGVVSLGTAAGASRTVTIGAGVLSVSGVISNGTTANSIIKDGAGTLTLAGANTFNGGLTIKSGTVQGNASAAFGATAGTITLGDSSGSNDASLLGGGLNSITAANPIVVASGSTGNVLTIGSGNLGINNTVFSGAVSLGHDVTLANGTINFTTFSGVISETGGARAITVKAGAGTVALTNSNTFTGGVTLESGRLQVGALNGTGLGSLTILGGAIDNNSTSTAAVINNSSYAWNGDFTFSSSASLTMATGNVTLNGDRTVTTNVITANALIVAGAIGDGGNGYGLTKDGPGTLTLQGASSYSGATTMTRGALNLNAAGSRLTNTSAVSVLGGTMTVGTTGAGVANRINPAAGLTLGGNGILSLTAGATGPVNSQSFTSLHVAPGSSQLSTTSATNAGTFAFTGAGSSVYSRAVGGALRIVVGTNTSFTNAPTGGSTAGSGTSAILIGAVMGTTATATSSTDFVRAGTGAVSAPTYGTNVWQSGVNTTVTTPLDVSGDTQSLRFNAAGDVAVTLAGASTVESGGILLTSTAVGGGTITGGQLQAASGKDLWIYTSTLATSPQGLTVSSLIADNGGSSLTKAGGGVLYLTNASNSYAGGTYLSEGILNITANGALGTGTLNFTGNATLQAGAADVNLGTRAITTSRGHVASFHTNGGGNTMTIPGVISGGGGLTKTGAGTLVLSGANTYTGVTSIDNGTLKLDFSAPGAPVNNIISSGSLFSPGGGSFLTNGAFAQKVVIQGKDATANSQTFGGAYTNVLGGYNTAGLFLNRGMTRLNLSAGENGGTLTVNLGTLSRGFTTDNNVSLNLDIGPGVTVTTTSPAGLLGSYATVNESTWASSAGGFIVPYTGYSSSYSTNAVMLDVGTGGTLSANPGSLRFNNSSAATVMTGSNVVRQLTAGGILVTPNVGANTSTITGASLTGFSARDLVIHQHNTAGDLQIDAAIVDTILRTMTVSKSGLGRTILNGPNTYTGQTYVNEGTLVVTADATTSFTRTANSATGSPTLLMSDTSNIFLGQSVTGASLTTSGTTWTVVAINPGVSVTLSSNANTGISGDTFTFGAGGALGAGGSTVHYVSPAGTLQIGNGDTTGSLLPGQAISNNGLVILNRSNDFTFANVINGQGSLEKQGAGNVTLAGASGFNGDTRISGGTLTLSTVATNLQGSTLDYNSYGGNLSFGTLAAATLGGLKGNQDLSLTNNNAAGVTLTVGANHQDTTYSGALSGAGALTKLGGGTLTLSGANSHAGSTSVAQGTLNLTGSFGGGGTVSISGGVLNLAGTFTDAGNLTVGGGVANLSGSYTRSAYFSGAGLNVTGGTLNVTGTLGTSAANPMGQTAFAGNSVTNFSGTVFLSGTSSTFRVAEISSATVNVTGGTVTIGTTSGGVVLGRNNAAASGFLNVSGGAFVTVGNTPIRIGAGFTDAETSGASVLSISGTGHFNTGATTGLFLLGSNLAGNTASTGTINLNGGTLSTNRSITGGSVGASIFNFNGGVFRATGTAATLATSLTTVNVRDGGAIIDSNGFNIAISEPLVHSGISGDNATDGGLTKNGNGTLTLSGTNTYNGPITVSGGTLKAGSAAALGTASSITLGNANGVTLDLGAYDFVVGSLAGNGDVLLGGTLFVGGNHQNTTFGGAISGAGGAVVKMGTGTWMVTGDNSYGGGTTVNRGALLIGNAGSSASALGSGAIEVQATAILGGNGRIALGEDQSITVASGGRLSVGNNALGIPAAGILELATAGTGTIQLDMGAAIELDLIGRGGVSDLLVVSGAISLETGSILRIGNPSGINDFAAGDEWQLFDWSGLVEPVNGEFGTIQLPSLAGEMGWDLSRLYSDGVIAVVVPEPSRALLLGAALLALAMRRRR